MKPITSIIELAQRFPDEKSARKYFEQLRWNGKITCPHCNNSEKKIYVYDDGKLYKCSACKKQFSVKVGTFMSDSQVPLLKWFMAVYLTGNHKKGISSIQLAKDIGVTQKTAWFMLHRIRQSTRNNKASLSGVVEADETYYGGKESNKHKSKRNENPQSLNNKTTIVGVVQRKGLVLAKVVEGSQAKHILPVLLNNVKPYTVVMTDQNQVYKRIDGYYQHHVVNHSESEFVRGEVHTQSIESFWSHLKRGINGIQHHVSPKHLDKYVSEYQHRWNTKNLTDMQRFELACSNLVGRLTYKELIKNK
jgi:transposase-like protein